MEPCAAAPFAYGVFLSQLLFWLAGSPSPSLLCKSTSPKGRGLGKKMKVVWIAKGSPFGGAGKSVGFD